MYEYISGHVETLTPTQVVIDNMGIGYAVKISLNTYSQIDGLKELTKGKDISINGEKREIETVILSLTGDIDLKQISKLTSKMNLPGGKHLGKAGEKN